MNKFILLPSIIRSLALTWAATLLVTGAVAGEVPIEYQGTRYRTYICAPEKVQLFWLDEGGKPFHQFSKLQEHLQSKGRKIHFIMNAGIFEEGGIPSGLLVVNGKTERPLNTSPGNGNFFLQPNGVFYVDSHGGHVVSTQDYASRKPAARYAVQSGPLLLNNGKTHPAFQAGSKNRLHRNGVGILPDGRVFFAISEFQQDKRPNLYEFADFFRSQGCRDALFLDGDISQMVTDASKPITPGNHFGAIFAVTD
jgi:uncharacterized protein YigE (DUF2233 family)